jgi:hypothetical protein
MPSLVIKINGKKLEFFDNVTLSKSIDAISSSFSFSSFYVIDDYEFATIEVLRNDIIIFKGSVFAPDFPNNAKPEPITYKCYSLTGILEDCPLPLSSYPIQTKNKSLKEIVDSICSSFDVVVKFDSSAESAINLKYTLQDQDPTAKASAIINKLCSQKNLILTHNSKGELIITKTLVGNNASPPLNTGSGKSYNYRKFYNKYLIIGQKSIKGGSSRQAEVFFDQIIEKRSITKKQSDGDAGSAQDQANALKFDSYKSNSLKLEFHDHFADTGEIYDIDGAKMISNAMNYNYNSTGETCTVDLLNAKVYDR